MKLGLLGFALIAVLGCQATDSNNRYLVKTIGNASRSVEATVLTAEPVTIVELTSGAGATAGGYLGGGIAADNSDSAGVIIAGIIAGAIVGDAIEGAGNRLSGTEYLIKTETGLMLTVAQVNEGNDILLAGENCILVYGYPNRLVKDPR